MPSQPRPSPLWQRLLLVVLSPVVFLGLAETAVRLSGIDTELARNERFEIAVPVWLLSDPAWVQVQHERLQRPRGVRAADVAWLRHFEEARYIQYRLKPGIDVRAVNPFNEIEVAKGVTFRLASNARGFRRRPAAGNGAPPSSQSADPRPERTAGAGRTLRIATLGDSSTFGWGVDYEHTFQAQLEARLQQRGVSAEVSNLGMPGFTSRHGLAVQRYYAADLDPDIVILSFGANDGRFGLQTADDALDANETWIAAVAWQLRRLESFRLLRRAIFSVYDPFAGLGTGEGAAPRPQVVSVPLPQYRSNLQRMAGLARQGGAEVIFLSVCAPDEYRQAMIELGRHRAIPVVDAGALFRDLADELRNGTLYPEDVAYYRHLYGEEALEENWRYYVTTDGCHPNRAGHRIIADALLGAIETVMAGRDPTAGRQNPD
jgi:lysophospholipase L1-like esterase